MKPHYRLRMRILEMLLAATCVLLLIAIYQMPVMAAEVNRVSISDLIQNMDEYDGRSVAITGEVIGDIMVRGNHAWITVNDESYSKRSLEQGGEFTGVGNTGIGVWAPHGEVQGIHDVGGYTEKGDTVEVVGVFHRACPEHGGDTDIHATSITVLEDGSPIEHPLNYGRLLSLIALVCIVAFLLTLWLKRRTPLGEQ